MTINTWWIAAKDFKMPTDTVEASKWSLKREEAARILLRSLSPTQFVHVEGMMDDPVEMWKKLKAAH